MEVGSFRSLPSLLSTDSLYPGHQIRSSLTPGEKITSASQSILDLLKLPKFIKRIFSYFMRSSDPLSSKLYDIMHTKTSVEDRELIAARDRYRAEWHKKWTDEGLDFILTVPLSLPAIENGASEKTTLVCAGYTFLFSVVRIFLCVIRRSLVDDRISSIMQLAFYQSRMSIGTWTNYRRILVPASIFNLSPVSERLPTVFMMPKRCMDCLSGFR